MASRPSNPNIDLQLELVPGFTAEFIPKILALAAGGQTRRRDLVRASPPLPDRLGVRYNVVRDLIPLAQAANYDLKKEFYPGRPGQQLVSTASSTSCRISRSRSCR